MRIAFTPYLSDVKKLFLLMKKETKARKIRQIFISKTDKLLI